MLINHNLHNMKQKGLSSVSTKKGEIIGVHLDLLKDEQLALSANSTKTKGKHSIDASIRGPFQGFTLCHL